MSRAAPPDASPDALAALIEASAQGDRAAFRDLYLETSAKLLGVVRRIVTDPTDAEEVVQDVYVRLWSLAPAFDASRGHPLGWLAAIARNRAIDHVRRHSRARTDSVPAPETPVPAAAEAMADREALERCLALLAEEQRSCVRLAYVEGWSREELAARFARPVGTIKSWLSRCLLTLRNCLAADD